VNSVLDKSLIKQEVTGGGRDARYRVRELRDICGRIAELIDLFAEADIVLEATLHETLSREALGFGRESQEEDAGPN
jgi:hypothetical protein